MTEHKIDHSKLVRHRMTKTKFEDMLIDKYGFDNISVRKTKEEGRGTDAGEWTTLSLYYLNGEHVGTWVNRSKCWTWEATEVSE